MLDSEKPDIVVGTESWLSPETATSEIFPKDSGYSTFREGRTTSAGGGVFTLVKDRILVSEQKHYKTDCEKVWVRIVIAGAIALFIASYYRPRENDEYSLTELRKSLDMVGREKGHIWILGDMDFPKLFWDEEAVPTIKPGCSCPRLYVDFIEILNDFSFSQVVREPTRCDNIIDLFLTTNSSPVNSVNILPGLSDHNIIKSEVSVKPKVIKQKPRKVHLYNRANWESFRSFMASFSSNFIPDLTNKTVEQAWSLFKSTLHEGINKFIPSKLIGSKKHLPWVTNSIRRDIQKRDNLFKKFKKSKSVESRKKFLRVKHAVKRKIRLSHDNYLEDILGLNNPSDNPEDVGKSDSLGKASLVY